MLPNAPSFATASERQVRTSPLTVTVSVGTKSETIICGELQVQEHLKIKLYGQEKLEVKRTAG